MTLEALEAELRRRNMVPVTIEAYQRLLAAARQEKYLRGLAFLRRIARLTGR